MGKLFKQRFPTSESVFSPCSQLAVALDPLDLSMRYFFWCFSRQVTLGKAPMLTLIFLQSGLPGFVFSLEIPFW